jgi:hypothetical protein
MKNIPKNIGKERVLIKEPHIRWNYDMDYPHNPEAALYFMSISGSKPVIKNTWKKIVEDITKWAGSIDVLREDYGRVGGTDYNYNLYVFESRAKPEQINWSSLKIPNVRDKKFYERVRTAYEKDGTLRGFSIENYVAQLFK